MSDGARVLAGILCLVVLASAAVPAVAQSGAGIGEVEVSGEGVIAATESGNGSTYLWSDESVNVSVEFTDYPEARNYRVCLGADREQAVDELDCNPKALSAGTNGTAEFANVTWPANTTGQQGLVVELQKLSNESNATVLDRTTVPVAVLRRQGDLDGDGLANAREVEAGYNVSNPDMDADGLTDGAEVNQYGSDPQDPDSDGDGIRDGIEIQRGTDPTTGDTDGDGLADPLEATLGTNPTNDLTPVWLVVGLVLVVAVLVAIGVFGRRQWRERSGELLTLGSNANSEPRADPDDGVDSTSGESTTEVAEPMPMTDEDRVLALLREHGGRMKQSQIVERTEWSKAKVSRLLSSMNEEGTVEKLSIGRENIISLDGHGPEAARSPHEENASD
ncbi:DUF7343 domain-containing protein [Halococcus sp. AFM35]|uniref:helix-turn-helix transcriptional regulator n=1 Tax=Halococcus sp. AFM35 TaxID=3421653 RepID=UPI003EB855CA